MLILLLFTMFIVVYLSPVTCVPRGCSCFTFTFTFAGRWSLVVGPLQLQLQY